MNARALYELSVKEHGQEAINTIDMGVMLAICLHESLHWIEAMRLMAKLVAISKRIHGADHKTTKEAQSVLHILRLFWGLLTSLIVLVTFAAIGFIVLCRILFIEKANLVGDKLIGCLGMWCLTWRVFGSGGKA